MIGVLNQILLSSESLPEVELSTSVDISFDANLVCGVCLFFFFSWHFVSKTDPPKKNTLILKPSRCLIISQVRACLLCGALVLD